MLWGGLWLPVLAFITGLWLLSDRALPLAPATGVDKLEHLAAYAVLGVLGLRAFHGGLRVPRAVPAALGVLLAAAYGALDEWHQSWVLGRNSSVADWVADCAGAGLALLLVGAWAARTTHRAEQSGAPRRAG